MSKAKIASMLKQAKKKISVYRRMHSWSKAFESNTSARLLSGEQKKEIHTFFAPYWKRLNLVLHEFYTQKTGNFYPEYIPDDLYYGYIDPFYNDWDAARVLDHKCFYRLLMKDIPQPATIALKIGGFWYVERDGDLQNVTVQQVVEQVQNHEVFVKLALESLGGHGVQYLGKDAGADEIRAVLNSVGRDVVIQHALKQSETMMALNRSSVNTVRVLSLQKRDGSVRIYSAIVRMGVNGAKVDNASSGGITCGVNGDGSLKPIAYAANGVRYYCHPDTGMHFETCVIPNYDKIKEIVEKTHPRFSNFRLLSWDFAIDEHDQPVLIELNMHNGELDFHQLNNGPLFGEDTEEILREVFAR